MNELIEDSHSWPDEGGQPQAPSSQQFVINPSDLTYLAEGCPRCLWRKLRYRIKPWTGPFPAVFRHIHDTIGHYYTEVETRAENLGLPNAGEFGILEGEVLSQPLSIPGLASVVVFKGRLDMLIGLDVDGYEVVDFKTVQWEPHHERMYGRQLHAYAMALENPAPGHLSLAPVKALRIMHYCPTGFWQEGVGEAAVGHLTGPVRWIEIPRDDAAFMLFVKEMVAVAEQAVPPPAAEGCRGCA